jgi:hypothetical protein
MTGCRERRSRSGHKEVFAKGACKNTLELAPGETIFQNLPSNHTDVLKLFSQHF